MKIRYILLILAIGILMLGCSKPKEFAAIVVEEPKAHEINDFESLKKALSHAADNPVKYKWEQDPGVQSIYDALPIGTILPYIIPPDGKVRFSNKWALANGSILDLPESPFHQKRLPELVSITGDNIYQPVYLAGSLHWDFYKKEFGNNSIEKEDGHNHSGSTGSSSNNHRKDNDGSDSYSASSIHGHNFTTGTGGEHDHGGNNMPRSYGVLYFIKVLQ